MKIHIIVNGVPVAKGRPRYTSNGSTYTPAKTKAYEKLVQSSFIEQCPHLKFDYDVSIAAHITFYFPIPKSAGKRKAQKMLEGTVHKMSRPDLDNLVKAVLDALNGFAFKDDAQVVSLTCSKRYGLDPRADIVLSEISME